MEAKKILFATVPLDGHFNPLTGLAMHLKNQGHDVRWYTGKVFTKKLNALGIEHYPFKRALEVTQENLDSLFPERIKIKGAIPKLKFDIKKIFIQRVPEYFEDIKEINKEFNFDIIISDISFGASPLVKELLNKKFVSMGIIPLPESSKDLAPTGLGLTPSDGFLGKMIQASLRFVSKKIIFKESTDEINKIFNAYGMLSREGVVFDIIIKESDLLLQSGIPAFEYKRSDLSKNIKFVGPLLPYQLKIPKAFSHYEKLADFEKVILVTQGTVERDPEKIIVPTLEAFKDTNHLVVVTTGGSKTEELRKRYPQPNIIIEDYIDFNEIMPLSDVYVTNGGYGGTLLGIQHQLPIVTAGIHEGKNEVAARVGYFKLGINLKTETPTAQQIKDSVEEVLRNPVYKNKVKELSKDFQQYNPNLFCERFINSLLNTLPKKQFEKAA